MGHISHGQIKESIVVDLSATFGPSLVFIGIVQARYFPCTYYPIHSAKYNNGILSKHYDSVNIAA